MLSIRKTMLAVLLATLSFGANAAEKTITMKFTTQAGVGEDAGTVTITETAYGILLTPNLHGLTPNLHGFHLHQNPSCEDNGMAAGGHFDPKHTNAHLGPYNNKGHLGDLPVLYVNKDGSANTPVLAPRIKHVSALKKLALMIHEGGDNYSDEPEKLGGGGGRMVCGVIE